MLALAMGMGVSPAQASLIVTQQQTALNLGSSVSIGPTTISGAGSAFTESYDSEGPFNVFNLTGAGNAQVAVNAVCSTNCKLETFNPGGQVDGSDFGATGASSGAFKTNGVSPPSDGNYYFGLDYRPNGQNSSNTYGWAEITLNAGAITLDEFAFEDTTNTAAPIPTVASVPEPGTLSLFAVGAAAVLARRKRKKALAA